MVVFFVGVEIVKEKITFYFIIQVVYDSGFFIDFDAETTTSKTIIIIIVIALV